MLNDYENWLINKGLPYVHEVMEILTFINFKYLLV